MHRLLSLILIGLILPWSLFAGAGFFENGGANQYQKVVFVFSDGGADEWKQVGAEVNGVDYGTKGSSDYWHLKGGEGYVWKNNGSDITAVTLWYRIYKEGDDPSYSAINLPWDSNLNATDQRWASTAADIDILAVVTSPGTWYVEFFYSAATNGVDCDNPIFFSNGGSNYKLSFTADASLSVSLSDFSAASGDGFVTLNWTTESEIDNALFILEKSLDKENYLPVAELEGQGNSSSRHEYAFKDRDVVNGTKYYYRLKDVNFEGQVSVLSVIEAMPLNRSGGAFALHGNFPNPFNPETTLRFTVNQASALLDIAIFNTRGQRVRNLVNSRFVQGTYELKWNGKDRFGSNLPSGAYYCRIIAPDYQTTQKMLLLR